MKLFLIIFILITLFTFNLYSFTEYLDDNWTNSGTNVIYQSPSGVGMNFIMSKIRINDVNINNILMHRIIIPEIYGPAEPGKPNFPRISRLVAIPQGSNVFINITGSRKRIFRNIIPSPAPESIPYNPINPIIYKPDSSVYFGYSVYPEEIIHISEPFKIRGVDIVQVTLEPFQWDPKTKDLTVYTNVLFQVSFTSGGGHIGEDRLRSRLWDRILQCNIVNYQSFCEIDYSKRATEAAMAPEKGYPYGAEFVIIVPDDSVFLVYADSIKKLRTEDGIITEIYTLSEVGTSFENIENWINYAYHSWNIPPEAILLLGDCNDQIFTQGIPSKIINISHHTHTQFASDNYYADVNGDELPEIVIGRIPVRDENDLENIYEKIILTEVNPINNFDFYNNVLVSGNFQYDIDFDHHVISEIIRGFHKHELSKIVTRLYHHHSSETLPPYQNHQSGDLWMPGGNNTWLPGLVDYFSSIGYITEYINEDFLNPGIWDKDGDDINTVINQGCFLVYNQGHGDAHTIWKQPEYSIDHLLELQNYNKLPYVYALGCWTGKFDSSFSSHAETFLLLSPNAFGEKRGSIGNTAASCSWGDANSHFLGCMDYIWKNFDPNYPLTSSSSDTFHEALPGFALVSGKYYMVCRNSNWDYNYSAVRLFHHFGDPYQRLYTELPQPFGEDDIQHNSTLSAGATYFNVLSPINSFMTLINEGKIIGRALSYGFPVNIPIVPREEGAEVEIVVTKQNFLRYYDTLNVIPTTGPYVRFIEIDTITGGLGNGQLNPEKKYQIVFEFANFGNSSAQEPYFYLNSGDSNIVIGNAEYTPRSINVYDTVYITFPCSLKSNIKDRQEIPLTLKYGYSGSDTLETSCELMVSSPVIIIEQLYTDISLYYPADSIFIGLIFKNIGAGKTYENYFNITTDHSMVSTIAFDTVFDTLVLNEEIDIDSSYQFIISLEPDSFWIIYDSLDILCEVKIVTTGNCTCYDSFTLGIKSPIMFRENFEDFEEYTWLPAGDTCWLVSTNNPFSGIQSMYNGYSDTLYSNNITDARIIAPIKYRIQENEMWVLSFWHWYDLQEGYDGVQVQINYDTTLNDTTWIPLYPDEGYSGTSYGYGGFTSGDSIYTGCDTIWQEQHLVIDSFVKINNEEIPYLCWRFGSDDSIVKEGYYFDDVIVFRYRLDDGELSELSEGTIEEIYRYSLSKAYPNIISSRTIITYSIAENIDVELVIYDILGREVRVLVDGFQRPGRYKAEWDGRDNHGSIVSSGTYFYRMTAGEFSAGEKLVVVR